MASRFTVCLLVEGKAAAGCGYRRSDTDVDVELRPSGSPCAGRTGWQTRAVSVFADLDDADLVVRARDGEDVEAFAELVHRHRDRAYRVALRITRHPGDAEDVAQEALVRAWRSLPGFRGEARFSTWLYRIVTNLALNRVERRPRVADVELPDTAVRSDDPAARTEDAERLTAALAALEQLSPDQRACYVLREIEGLSYEELAEVLETSVPAVKSRLFRARQELTAALARYDAVGREEAGM
jgi:RNA polymerase sigma-70 factor (ECF subfamily)